MLYKLFENINKRDVSNRIESSYVQTVQNIEFSWELLHGNLLELTKVFRLWTLSFFDSKILHNYCKAMITVHCIKIMCYDSKPLELMTCHQISLTTLTTSDRCISTMITDRIPYSSFILYPVCWEYPSAALFAANMNMKFYSFCSKDCLR